MMIVTKQKFFSMQSLLFSTIELLGSLAF